MILNNGFVCFKVSLSDSKKVEVVRYFSNSGLEPYLKFTAEDTLFFKFNQDFEDQVVSILTGLQEIAPYYYSELCCCSCNFEFGTECWRYVYRGMWKREEGEVVYGQKVTYDELDNAFHSYVDMDAEVAELDYIRDALSAAGIGEEDLERFGFGWVIPDD